MWSFKGPLFIFFNRLIFSLKENVSMASKKALNGSTEVSKKNIFQRYKSTASDSEKSVMESDRMESKSMDSDGKKVIRRSSMICSEGFDKYTFDCHRADLSKSSQSDADSSVSSELILSQNSVTSTNSSDASAKFSKASSLDPSTKKTPFFKPATSPSFPGKMPSSPFKRVPDQTISGGYKRVPEETIPMFQLGNVTANKSSVTNIPLSFTPITEKPSSSSSMNNLNQAVPHRSPQYSLRHVTENTAIRNPPLTLKTIAEEQPVNNSFSLDPMPVESTMSVSSKQKQKLIAGDRAPLIYDRLEPKSISSSNPSPYIISNESTSHRTKPLFLKYASQQSGFGKPTNILTHSSMRSNSVVGNAPLSVQTVSEESLEEQKSSLPFKNIQDEPMPIRNSPLFLKPILSKHLSLLKKKNPNEACKVIKRDSIVHPDRIHMQGSMCIDGRFQNPWPTWRPPTFTNILKFGVSRNNSKVPPKQELDLILPIVKQKFSKLTAPEDIIRVTWIGHSTLLIQMHGLNILTDPIFSDRASPSQVIGPKRYREPPCSIHDLPKINAVIISHSHYDHLDYNTITLLNARFGSDLRWFVPLGLQTWMHDVGCENVVELDWWEENFVPEHSDTFFVFTPAQHWSKRTIGDDNKVLWGSWCIIGPKYRFFFAGDTGYCDVFKQIGRVHGPFDLSAIPIGAYEPRWFMKYQHINPEEAVKIHMDVRSKKSVAIHWGTFCLANEYYLDPPVKLREGLDKYEISPELFFTMKHGESKIIAQSNLVKNKSLCNNNLKNS